MWPCNEANDVISWGEQTLKEMQLHYPESEGKHAAAVAAAFPPAECSSKSPPRGNEKEKWNLLKKLLFII
jgi:hypothetical protein